MELVGGLEVGRVAKVYLCVPIVPLQIDFSGDEYLLRRMKFHLKAFPLLMKMK